MDDDSSARAIVGSILLFALIIAAIVGVYVWEGNSLNNTCRDRFGTEWSGRMDYYSQDICANSNGDVKYP